MASKKHIFSPIEKKEFLGILKRYSCVIENKNTDGASLRAKQEAWCNVAREFNSNPIATAQVTSAQLRKLWLNLKHRQRDALTKERQYRMATGGGPSRSNAEIDSDVSAIAPSLIVGIEEAIDSDTFPLVSSDARCSDEEIPGEVVFPEFPRSPESPFSPRRPRRDIVTPSPTYTRSRPPTPSPRYPSVPSPPPRDPLPPHRAPTPPPRAPTPPPLPIHSTFQRQKNMILSNEYRDRKRRADAIHAEEIKILLAKKREANANADVAETLLREAIAKAELAELLLRKAQRSENNN